MSTPSLSLSFAPFSRLLSLTLLLGLAGPSAQAIDISLRFVGDTFLGESISEPGPAIATVRKAAADVSRAITTRLSAMNVEGDGLVLRIPIPTATDGGPGAGFENVLMNSLNLEENEFRIYVGLTETSTYFGAAATPLLINPGNLDLSRGGPFFDERIGLGYLAGGVSLSRDTDWHLDYRTPVEMDRYDLYTTAAHEFVHTLGVGTSQIWHDPNVIIDRDTIGFVHLADPSALMAASLELGERRFITPVDLEVLEILGWAVIPETSSYALLFGLIAGGFLFRRRHS